MATQIFPKTLDAAVTVEDRLAVGRLVCAGETAEMPEYAAPRGVALLLLAAAALLSADPDGGEPIEDAHGGVVQNLACARAF